MTSPGGTVPVKFDYIASQDASIVELSGNFNNWSRVSMRRDPTEWSTTLELLPGQYEYKFIVDNEWRYNHQKPTTKNSMGEINNVIIVQDLKTALIHTREALMAALESEKSGGGETALLSTVSKDKTEVCRVLLDAGSDVNRCNDSEGTSPLMKASINGNVEITTMLLSAGAQIDNKENLPSGKTALFYAASKGHFKIAKMIVDKGKEAGIKCIDICEHEGGTPLIAAAEKGHTEILKLLMDNGAELDKQNNDGDTALIKAAQSGCADICEILLEAGGDINKRNNGYYGETALDVAKEKNNYEVLEVLKKYSDSILPLQLTDILNKHETSVENIDEVDNAVDSTPLCYSVTIGNKEACKLLLEAGAKVNKAYKGQTALNLAAKNGHADICSILLEAEADVEFAGDDDCYTPLMNAIKFSGSADVVKLLIKAGVDLSKQTSDGQTALCLASRHNHLDIVKLLILQGVEVDFTPDGSSGWTPLMAAAEQGNAEICNLLMDNGANLDKQNDNGDTALIRAAENGWANICVMLLSAGADINKRNNGYYGKTAMDIAQEKNKSEVVDELEKYRDSIIPLQLTEVLNKHGITEGRIDCQDKDGYVALHYAAANGKKEACKLLIDAGADVNKKSFGTYTGKEQTALNSAAINGYKDICQILLDAGAKVDSLSESKDSSQYNRKYKTPLMHVIENQGNIDIVNLLIKMGADLNVSDKYGMTPLGLAIQEYNRYPTYPSLDTIKALIKGGADVNKASNSGTTPLMNSILKDTTELCQLLLEAGAKVNSWDESGMTALNMNLYNIYSIYKENRADFIQILLDAGATLEYHKNAKPPLFYAIEAHNKKEEKEDENLKIIKMLIKAGSDVNLQFKRQTPLIHAMYQKGCSTAVVELLIEAGADVEITNERGDTPLMIATYNNQDEIFQLLLKAGAEVDKENVNGWTALVWAAKVNFSIYDLLTDAGANVEKAWEKYQKHDDYYILQYVEMKTFISPSGADKDLKKAFHTGKTGLFYAASIGEERIVRSFINDIKNALSDGTELTVAAARAYINICTDEEWTPLMAAAQGGHIEICKLLMDFQGDINKQNNNGETALIKAAENGHSNVCDILVKAGADLDRQNKNGDTALMKAIEKTNSKYYGDISKMLVAAGAQLDIQNNKGDTALTLAVESYWWNSWSSECIYKYLIEAGADLDKQNENGDTALTKAAKLGKADICEMFFVAGADINKKNNDYYGENAMDIAKGKKYSAVIEVLEKYGDSILPLKLGDILKKHGISENNLDEITTEGHTELYYAASNGKTEACKLLIQAGANINIMHEGDTALNVAVKNGHADTCQMLIDANADIDTEHQDGFTPLMNAIKVPDNVQVVKVLIKAGADINKQNAEGQPPIFLAASHDQANPDIVEALILGGAEVDLAPEGSLGWTPLMVAAKYGNESICQLLLNKGALINKQNDNGDTALIISVENDWRYTCEILLSAKADVNKQNNKGDTALIKAPYSYFSLLLEAGADINKRNNDQKTALDISKEVYSNWQTEILEEYKDSIIPLHLAVANGNTEDCKALIEAGTDVNKIYNYQTPLCLAATNGYEEICQMLLGAGAQLNQLLFDMVTNQNCSPLMGIIDIINLLIKMGADLNADNDSYETPLHLAARYNCLDVVKALIEGGADIDFGRWTTPLIQSVQAETPEICQLLLEAGAQVDKQNGDGKTALACAAMQNKEDIAKILVKSGADIGRAWDYCNEDKEILFLTKLNEQVL